MAGSATSYEENLALAQSAMGRYAKAPLPHLIAGRRVLSRSGETFTNHSPIDGRVLGEVAAGDAADQALDWRSATSGELAPLAIATVDKSMADLSTRIGVLGGGQLGRMMAQAASRIGVSITVLDPGGISSPAGQVCGKAIEGSFTDAASIRKLAEVVDVITIVGTTLS